MIKSLHIKLILITPIFILLTHYLAVYPHEYSHSIMAWLLGYKSNPFAIDDGGTSWSNIFLLFHVDENVNYNMIFLSDHYADVALIAFAGPGIANGLLFIASYFLLKKRKIQQKQYVFYFLFLFNLMNLGNLYDYVPIRTFSNHGDVAHFNTGLHISPWWTYAVFGYLIAFLIWQFLTKTLISVFIKLEMTSTFLRASLMILCVCILFGYFAMPGFFNDGDISYFLSGTSFLMIPGIVIAAWPTRAWVQRQLEIGEK